MMGTLKVTILVNADIKLDARQLEGEDLELMEALGALASEVSGDPKELVVEKHVHRHGQGHGHSHSFGHLVKIK